MNFYNHSTVIIVIKLMKLVLLGIQGSGKSTQGNILSRQLNIPYLSTGHIFRQIAKEKTKLGRYIKETINTGILVPDEKTIEIVNQYLSRSEYRNGYILDGFPRTVTQAKRFMNNVDKVIFIKISDKEALWRLLYRNESSRADETLPALKKRIEMFKKYTIPVIDYYGNQKKLVVIDGEQSIKEVNKEILRNLGKQLIKNHIASWKRKIKTIIAIVGLPGVGKTAAAQYFKNKGLPVISFGKVINEYITENHLSHNEKNHQKIRSKFRKDHGMAALAILNLDKIKALLKDNLILVIDGMRSWEEYEFLKKELPKINIFLVGLYADKDVRYRRVSQRRERSELYGKERDINELFTTNMGPTFTFSDYLIKNNFSEEEFFDKLEDVYRSIYFSL
ncbi:hypothetical protein CO007_03290 [Candidatus Roizmanbacteria bacterium CG_4_8_14_3_um_filter_36_10]|uniref:Adenylate kinase n=1 Tax=Candidatus Roizmanbacteria bacterium CG_4_8_14_3_um_filter_36_10 TaxID=1974834 RepID=A0A2M8GMB2_9BACT|nr:MAG: hypothetical protein CO007_03290 [Candidatus Roizmanbacteria bacterium CG_4_8_14_3_um_filter_36_10]